MDLRANSIRANLLANNLDAVEGWSDVWTGSTWGSLAVVACRDKHCTLERYNDSSCIIRWYDSEGDAVYAYSALKQRTYNWLLLRHAPNGTMTPFRLRSRWHSEHDGVQITTSLSR